MPISPLKAIESVLADPMLYLRVAAEERHGEPVCTCSICPCSTDLLCSLDEVPSIDTHAENRDYRATPFNIERDKFSRSDILLRSNAHGAQWNQRHSHAVDSPP
jgi:hypothetical protein